MNTAAAFADFRTYPLISALTAVHTLADRIQVQWADDRVSPFHHQWLRDNCPCPLCVYTVTREQVLEIVDVAENLIPDSARIDAEGCLCIDWQDGHLSRFDPGWLRAHAYDDESRAERRAAKPKSKLWDSHLKLPVFDYQALMNDNEALLQWLLAVRDIGLTQVRGVPTEPVGLQRCNGSLSLGQMETVLRVVSGKRLLENPGIGGPRPETLPGGICPDEKSERIPVGLKLQGCPAT